MRMPVVPLALELDYVTVLKYMKPPQPGAATLWWIAATIIGAIALFALFEILARFIRRARRIKRSQAKFNQLTLVCQLTSEEIKLLKHLVDICGIKFPDRVFTSFELFNKCLEDDAPASLGAMSAPALKRLRILRNKIFFGERSRLPPITSTQELKANQWLHLRRESSGEVLMAPVVEASPKGLLVATPLAEGERLGVEPGESFDVYFWRDRDASYRFRTEVIGQSKMRSLITVFKHAENIERIQRRRYHRVETSIPVAAIPVTRDELDKIIGGEEVDRAEHPGLQAFVVDISAAGFALSARTPLAINDLVYVELLNERERSRLPVIGKVLGVTEREATDEYLMHAEFVGLSTEFHEKVFQLIYFHSKQGTASA